MKNGDYVEQLLTGYIDGELTEREKTELKRLMRNDPDLEKHLVSLQGCRTLLGSLPVEKAPADTVKRVQVAAGLIEPEKIEPQSRQPQQKEPDIVKQAAKELIMRKALSAAAIILLGVGLLAIVWTIISPEKPANSEMLAKDNGRTIIEDNLGPKDVPVTDTIGNDVVASGAGGLPVEKAQAGSTAKETPDTPVIAPGFSATLQMKAEQVLAADVSVKKIFEQVIPAGFSGLPTQPDRFVYSVSCDVEQLNTILGGLEAIWNQFSEAKLSVDSGTGQNPVVIAAVRTWQIGEIAALSDPQKRIKAAQYYSISNNAQPILEKQTQIADLENGLFELIEGPKPKPVLTSDEQAGAETTSNHQVHLIIEIYPNE